MNPKERVFRVIRGLEADRFPSQVDFTPAAADMISQALGIQKIALNEVFGNHIIECFSLGSVEEYLQDPGMLESAIGLDLAHMEPGDHLIFDDWGVGWDLIPDGGWPAVHPLADLSDYPNYQLPNPNKPHLMDEARKIHRDYGDHYFVAAAHHTALFERGWALRGFENHLMDFYDRQDFIEELYDRIADYQVELAKNFIAAGVHGAVVGDDYGTQHGMIMKPALWRKLIKPRLKRIIKTYQDAGVPVIQHTCGDIRPILEDLIEIRVDVIHPIQPLAMSIDEVIERCGDRICFFGGIDTQRLLPYGTPPEIERMVRTTIQTLGRYGRYIIAPAQAIMPDVPAENILALMNAIKQTNVKKL